MMSAACGTSHVMLTRDCLQVVVFALGIGTSKVHLLRLVDALVDIYRQVPLKEGSPNIYSAQIELFSVPSSIPRLSPREAFFAEKEL